MKVEILLDDWIPRKIVAPAEYLAKAPDLLRAFIPFAHAEVGLRSDLTDETLAAIDDWEPQYRQTIHSPRPQGPAALLAALGIDTENMTAASVGTDGPESFERSMLGWLALDVGDQVQLGRLDEEILDVEYRTASRRVLARVACGDPEVFRRKGRAETAAAAILWIVGKANDLFGAAQRRHAGQRPHEPFRPRTEHHRPARCDHVARRRIR